MRSQHSAKAASSASCNSPIPPTLAGSGVKARMSLSKVIRYYEIGGEIFGSAEDIVPSSFWEEPLSVLRAWTDPAMSRDEAFEALRMAATACEEEDYELSNAMVRAASLFFEKDTSSSCEAAACVSAVSGLLGLICAYELGMRVFNQAPEAVPDSVYEVPLELLKSWSAPASSREEAMQAIRLADKALDEGDSDLAEAMVRAARLFFDSEASAPSLPVIAEKRVYDIGRAVDEVDGVLSFMQMSLPGLSDHLEGTEWVAWVAAAESAVNLIRCRLEFASEELHEIGLHLTFSGAVNERSGVALS